MSSYTHFTLDERKYLQQLLESGYGIRACARALGRNPSSVSRELKRNSSKKGYHHWRAQVLCVVRRRQCRPIAIPEGSPVWNYVIDKLNLFWSPEEIAMRWRLEHPNETLGTSTIYRYIHKQIFPAIKKKTHLRRRGKNKNYVHHNSNVIHPERLIPQWPQEIIERSRLGDWEGDTVYGSVGKGLIVSLVDRKSRYLLSGRLNSRNAEETRRVIERLLSGHPVHSLSLDNGSEFSQFKELEQEIHAPIFFAQPHKPWQRGTNENTNGILRFFFPKGCDFHSIRDDDLDYVVSLINSRPGKCLGWRSPFEVFFGVALR